MLAVRVRFKSDGLTVRVMSANFAYSRAGPAQLVLDMFNDFCHAARPEGLDLYSQALTCMHSQSI